MRVAASSALLVPVAIVLTGCSLSPTVPQTAAPGIAIQGNVHGGQQPVSSAHVYLFAANTTGYGAASVSLLNAATTGLSDSVGAYVLTDAKGAFSITGDYTCTSGQQVYLYAAGGNTGAGSNPSASLMADLGNCPGTTFSPSTFIWINEVSTVAAAYAMAGFATDPTHVSSSGTTLSQTGIANAFANATNLAGLATGQALLSTPGGNGTVPQTTINTLANFLASCVNSTGAVSGPTNPTTCYTLFNNALSAGSSGSVPADTATAAINIAHNPGVNIANLCALQTGVGAAFLPDLPCTSNLGYPTDFALALSFTGGGLSQNAPWAVAIDASGNAWIADWLSSNVAEFSPLGVALSPSTGFTAGGVSGPKAIAIDLSGNVWTANTGNNSISKLTSTGTAVSGSNGYTGGGLFQAYGIAVDASNNIWLADGSAVAKFSNTGTPISPTGGYSGAGINTSDAVAIDASGNAWFGDNSVFSGVSKFSNTGAPIASYTGGGLNAPGPTGVAIDSSGNLWAACDSGIAKLSNSGTAISPSAGYSGGGLGVPQAIAMDGAGNAWVSNTNTNSVAEWSNSGATISPSTGYRGSAGFTTAPISGPMGLAIDGSGDIWVASANKNVVEFIGAATPVVTPIVAGVKNNAIATRP